MFKYLILLVLAFSGLNLLAHPTEISGSLDQHGGHNCWANCEQWGLRQGEYHIHKK